jgi:dTDP-glucose 4,6-dehydratase
VNILGTHSAGFVDSGVIRHILAETWGSAVNIGKLPNVDILESLHGAGGNSRGTFGQVDICDGQARHRVFDAHRPVLVMCLATESHVNRSIDGLGPSSRPTRCQYFDYVYLGQSNSEFV